MTRIKPDLSLQAIADGTLACQIATKLQLFWKFQTVNAHLYITKLLSLNLNEIFQLSFFPIFAVSMVKFQLNTCQVTCKFVKFGAFDISAIFMANVIISKVRKTTTKLVHYNFSWYDLPLKRSKYYFKSFPKGFNA